MRRFSLLRVIRLVHLRELRLHPLRTLVAVVAVAAGVSMVLSISVVVSSTTESFRRQATALAGPAPLRIVGPTSAGGLFSEDLDVARSTDGVAAAAPMVRSVVHLERPSDGGVELTSDVLVIGIDCATAQTLALDCATLEAGALATPSLIDTEEPNVLRTDAGPLVLDSVTESEPLEALGPRTVVVILERAQRLFLRADRLDVIYVIPTADASVDDVRDRLDLALADGLRVLDATQPPPELDQVLAAIVPLFGLIGLLALAIGMILVANTLTLSLEERRLQLAIVGALGGTGRQVVLGALIQAACIGIAGGLLGTLGAIVLAYPLTASVSSFTLPVAGIRVDALPSQAPVLLGVLLGGSVAAVAAWRPARRAMRSDVAGELSRRDRRDEAETHNLSARALFVTAIGLFGAGLAAAGGADGSLRAWQPGVGLLGLVIAITGLAVAMGRTTAALTTALLRRFSPGHAGLRLAFANLAREPSRTGVMAVAIGAAVGTAFIVSSFNQQAKAGITEGITAGNEGFYSVSVGDVDGSEMIFNRVPPSVVDAVEAETGVTKLERGTFVFTSNDDIGLAINGIETDELRGPRVYEGTADTDRFLAGEVMIGAAVARSQGIGAGDMVRIPVHDGIAELPVQGVWANGNAVGNSVMMPRAILEELFGPQPSDGLFVQGDVDPETIAAAVRTTTGDAAVRVEDGAAVAERIARDAESQLAPFWALQRGLTVVAFIAVLSTLLLVGVQRTRELGLLAAVGMEPRAIAAMVLLEAVIVAVLASVVAGVGSVLMSLALGAVTPLILGWENPIRFAPWSVPLYGSVTVVVALAGAALPAWRAARVKVVEALAYE